MTIFPTPAGFMTIRSKEDKLCAAEFSGTSCSFEARSAVEIECVCQLQEYFAGRREKFDLPLMIEGSEFESAVWDQLLKIPYGQTRSYGEIAAQMGLPGAARAVGMACHRNKLAVIVPCHRVIGCSGKLVGYASGVDRKNFLLSLEKGERWLFGNIETVFNENLVNI